MLRVRAQQKGFTIVELLIVIAVIGILAALVLNTFVGVQRRARDVERETDVNAIATQLEVYYNDEGQYPTLANMQDAVITPAGWLETNLPGLDLAATIAPGDDAAAGTNSMVNDATPNADQYGYIPAPAGCDNTATDCTSFVLHWAKEDDSNAAQSKSSLN